ncbi:glycosyltransferase family 2 protein [Candidatus Parcubacteria bacterium]|nr:MAG: glycosyltransferase family 2 protein [Candidatus Parcubacteria bacterium]
MISGSPSAQQTYPISVVIATLGGESLAGTIEQLNRGTIVPAEILVCIPEEDAFRVENLSVQNVRVINTNVRGQVAQRAIGFQQAQYDVVMQLDDDILTDENCISYLLDTLTKFGPHVAVAPALVGRSYDKFPKMNGMMLKMFYFLVNGKDGYQMGAVSKAGAEIGYDPSLIKEGVYNVEWLAGGCLMHFRENLVNENFFPYQGKSYCEDLLHSHHLTKKGIRLKLDARTRCSLENVSTASYGIKEFINFIYADYRVRKYFVRLSSRSYLRMHLYYMALVCNYLMKKMIAKVSG